MYLFKLLISASLKRHFHVLSYAGKDKKINQGSGSTVAGFVFILVLMFALQYLIKLGNEVGLAYQSPPRYILLKQFLGKEEIDSNSKTK
jgi:hypothetical protein